MTHTAAAFDRYATTYDAARRRLVPCYDRFYGTVLELLTDLPSNARVLDLGAGTGLLSAHVKAAHPHIHLTLVDNAEAMLDQARERFRGCERIDIRKGDIAALSAPEESFDAVISALAIHHLENPDKRVLMGRVWRWLKPGGVFVNADQIAGPTRALSRRYTDKWYADTRLLGATDDDLRAAEERMVHDRCAPPQEQLFWLAQAGFPVVDMPFRDGMFAVFAAYA